MSTASSYDRLNSLLFFPTGSLKVRHRFVESMSIRRGDRVLEVGCGTGQVTQALLAAGADVVAVEQLPAMLLRARRRAPEATFVATDFRTFPAGSDCDLTVLAFVLHNFDCRVGPRSPPSLRRHPATSRLSSSAVRHPVAVDQSLPEDVVHRAGVTSKIGAYREGGWTSRSRTAKRSDSHDGGQQAQEAQKRSESRPDVRQSTAAFMCTYLYRPPSGTHKMVGAATGYGP